jgi:hypothetical protein
MPLSLAICALLVGNALFAAWQIRAPRVAIFFNAAMLALFPFLSDSADWEGWMDGLKRYSIVIPACLCSFVHAWPHHRFTRSIERVLVAALILNIVEMGLGELIYDNFCNALLIFLVACTVPFRWVRRGPAQRLGFRDPLWLAAYTGAIGRIFLFNPAFENIALGALIIYLTLLAALALARDTHDFISWRVYTIYFLVLQDSIFPTFSDWLYPAWMQPAQRLAVLEGTVVDYAWLTITAALVAAVLWRRWRTAHPTAAALPAAS